MLKAEPRLLRYATYALSAVIAAGAGAIVLAHSGNPAVVATVMLVTLSVFALYRGRARVLSAAVTTAYDQRARARAIIDAAFDGIIEVDARGTVRDLNLAAENTFGVRRDAALGRHLGDFVDWYEDGGGGGSAHLEGPQPGWGEMTGRRADGSTFPVELSVAEVESGGERFYAVTVRDVSEQKRATAQLQASERRLRVLAGTTRGLVLELDRDGRYLNVWAEDEALLARPRLEMLGRTMAEVLGEEAASRFLPTIRSVIETGTRATYEYQLEVQSGTRWFETEVERVTSEDGGSFNAVFASRDITERRTAAEALRRSEERDRLASLGTLAAGVAHEINNPLAYTTSNIGFALDELKALMDGRPGAAFSEVSSALEEARDGAKRVAAIVRDLRLFSRPEVRPGGVSLNRVAESAMNMAMNEIRHRARLEVMLEEDLPLARGDELKLGQVVLNLIINATQALPEGQAERHRIEVSTSLDSRGWPTLKVRDTGCGVPWENLQRIFDPFFTTKPVGVGTGLGLSICQGIVVSLGGDISVESAVGQGATFTVTLPRSESPPDQPEAVAAASGGCSGHVLVVDDEPLIGRSLQRILTPQHRVEVAANVTEALSLLGQRKGNNDFGVILCDLMMPDRTGIDLYQELQRKDPSMAKRMVFMTGGAFTPRANEFLSQFAGRRLDKPVDASAVRRVVADVLSQAA